MGIGRFLRGRRWRVMPLTPTPLASRILSVRECSAGCGVPWPFACLAGSALLLRIAIHIPFHTPIAHYMCYLLVGLMLADEMHITRAP